MDRNHLSILLSVRSKSSKIPFFSLLLDLDLDEELPIILCYVDLYNLKWPSPTTLLIMTCSKSNHYIKIIRFPEEQSYQDSKLFGSYSKYHDDFE